MHVESEEQQKSDGNSVSAQREKLEFAQVEVCRPSSTPRACAADIATVRAQAEGMTDETKLTSASFDMVDCRAMILDLLVMDYLGQEVMLGKRFRCEGSSEVKAVIRFFSQAMTGYLWRAAESQRKIRGAQRNMKACQKQKNSEEQDTVGKNRKESIDM